MKGSYIVVGATASIGRVLVRELARQGYGVICVGRDGDEVAKVALDAQHRYRVVSSSYVADAVAFGMHDSLMKEISRLHTGVLGLILVQGALSDDDGPRLAASDAQRLIDVNYTSVVTLSLAFAKHFPRRGNVVAVVSSVAGERGKRRNLVYSGAKSAVSVYLQGLRQTFPHLTVVDIRPGLIDTPMTYGGPGRLPAVSPEIVAKDIVRGIRRRKRVVYTPFWYRYVMSILRNLPTVVYDRLPF